MFHRRKAKRRRAEAAQDTLQWLALLARTRGRLVVEVARLLEDDPEALITEVAAVRLEWAQEAARALEATESKKRPAKLLELKTSDRFDDRLAAALFEQHQTYQKLRKEWRSQMQAAQRKARTAARERSGTA